MAGHDPLCHWFPVAGDQPDESCDCPLIAKVRADERERMANLARKVPGGGIIDYAGLRAKVEALPERGISMTWDHPEGCALVWRADVLALFDGAGDA